MVTKHFNQTNSNFENCLFLTNVEVSQRLATRGYNIFGDLEDKCGNRFMTCYFSCGKALITIVWHLLTWSGIHRDSSNVKRYP